MVPVGQTRIVVPVAEVAARVEQAYIAIVDPFLAEGDVDSGVRAELGELFAGLVPFRFMLGEPTRFPDGELYLPPQPVTLFRRLTHRVRQAFPEIVGPTTPLDTVVPHLGVPDEDTVPTPLEVYARAALLLAGWGPDQRTIATFPFGTSAA